MSIMDIPVEPKQRRKRGPNKPKVAAPVQVQIVDDGNAAAMAAAMAKAEAEALAKAKRQFEDNWPFLTVDLRMDGGALEGTATFGRLEVTGRAPNAQRLARDFREWARYQLWQKERAPEIEAWYKGEPDRFDWLEIQSRPITRMDRPEPKKTR